jgi:hypothetical protein
MFKYKISENNSSLKQNKVNFTFKMESSHPLSQSNMILNSEDEGSF